MCLHSDRADLAGRASCVVAIVLGVVVEALVQGCRVTHSEVEVEAPKLSTDLLVLRQHFISITPASLYNQKLKRCASQIIP